MSRAIRRALGILFIAAGIVAVLYFGFWGMSASVTIIGDVLSGMNRWLSAIIAIFFFPLTLALAPFIALARGDWSLLAIIYGGAVLVSALFGLGAALMADDRS